MRVVLAHFERDEPAVYGQNFGRDDRVLSVSNGAGTELTDIACTDGGFVPALKPVE